MHADDTEQSIKQLSSYNYNTIVLPVNSNKVKQFVQKLNPRKTIGQDKIPQNGC